MSTLKFRTSLLYTSMSYINRLLQFYWFVVQRFFQQRCNETAASLSYTSLLSLVPLMAVVFAGFSSFSVFEKLFAKVQRFVFENFVPSSSEVIQQYLHEFVGKASQLTLVGLISLFVIALMLMWQIDRSLNQIWAVKRSKNILRIFLIYWATLTLGPLLIGISLMITSYITSLPVLSNAAELVGLKTEILAIIPVLLTLLAFTLIYLIIPNTRVNLYHALVGGLTATVLFELSKIGFAFYISNNETYRSLYGALATLPIFLVWIYISWLVTLLGAMTTRCMALFDFSMSGHHLSQHSFISVFHVLRLLYQASRQGITLSQYQLQAEPVLRFESEMDAILNELEGLNWIHRTENKNWALTRDLDSITLWDLYYKLPYSLPKHVTDEPLSRIIGQINKHLAEELNQPVKNIFSLYDKQ